MPRPLPDDVKAFLDPEAAYPGSNRDVLAGHILCGLSGALVGILACIGFRAWFG